VAAIAPVAGRAAAQQAPPVISGVQPSTIPAYGPATGASHVLIKGREFQDASRVEFGGVPGAVEHVSKNSISARAPGHSPGAVFVTVTTPEGASSVTPAALLIYVEPGAGEWAPTGFLTGDPSELGYGTSPKAIRLPDGSVLMIAGAGSEIYRPDTTDWSPTRSGLGQRRLAPAAVSLSDGRVLASGGGDGSPSSNDGLATAEIYDPRGSQWTPTPTPMTRQRKEHTATLLKDGRVLVVGGLIGGPLGFNPDQARADRERITELYDPRTGTWTPTGSLNVARFQHTATILPGGKVLVAGGIGRNVATSGGPDKYLDSAEVYDPATGQWAFVGSLAQARAQHTATLLPDGNVLVVGGNPNNALDGRPLSSAEIFDSNSLDITTGVTGLWRPTGIANSDRYNHAAASLPDGRVLVVGGRGSNGTGEPRDTAEIYDPSTQRWTYTKHLDTPRSEGVTATTLSTGQVLVAGGVGHPYADGSDDFSAAELFTLPAKLPITSPTDAPTTPPTQPPPTIRPPDAAPPAPPRQVTLAPSKPVPVKQIPLSDQPGAAVASGQNKVLLIPPGTSGLPPQPTLVAQFGPGPGPAPLGSSFGAQPGASANVGAAASGQSEPDQAPSPAYRFSALPATEAGLVAAGLLLLAFTSALGGHSRRCLVQDSEHRAEPGLAWAVR